MESIYNLIKLIPIDDFENSDKVDISDFRDWYTSSWLEIEEELIELCEDEYIKDTANDFAAHFIDDISSLIERNKDGDIEYASNMVIEIIHNILIEAQSEAQFNLDESMQKQLNNLIIELCDKNDVSVPYELREWINSKNEEDTEDDEEDYNDYNDDFHNKDEN